MKLFLSFFFLWVTGVICAQEADYVSLEDRLRSNIFLKVEASSTDCFVGEPIIVTYKLYSAMASESSVLRQPAFPGFEVKDLKALAGGLASRETVDGVAFDVHTILKLQLTPYESGTLSLGALTMRNRVRLVHPGGRRDPVLNGVEEGYALDNGYFTLTVHSVPIPVLVTELPANTRSSSKFEGLVGDFKMEVRLSEKLLTPDQPASLLVTISGKGDHSKIQPPKVAWPEAVRPLPVKIDRDPTRDAGGGGYTTFEFPFQVRTPGTYTIPSIAFSFFDAVQYQYKTITNIPVQFTVVDEKGGPDAVVAARQQDLAQPGDRQRILVLAGLALVLVLGVLWWRRVQKPARSRAAQALKPQQPIAATPDLETLLQPAIRSLEAPGNDFHLQLKDALTRFLEPRLGLEPGTLHQHLRADHLTQSNLPTARQQELLSLFTEIDQGIYSGGMARMERVPLLEKTRALLAQL